MKTKYQKISRLKVFMCIVSVSLPSLRSQYNSVVLSPGAQSSRAMGCPGESLDGVVSARDVVLWYNGHPEYEGRAPLKEGRRVERMAVVGHGNVALDVARYAKPEVGPFFPRKAFSNIFFWIGFWSSLFYECILANIFCRSCR
jgi:hypothetical protein